MAESVERMKERAYGRSLEQQWMSLTPAEQRVASMVAKGLSNSVVADALEISERTIRAHKEAIYRKLDIENAVELAEFLRERADFFGGGDAAA